MTMEPDAQVREAEERYGAEWMLYGPAGTQGAGSIALAATFGEYEAEYAAIRRHVGIMHLPQRGILRFTGEDRLDFLHRMLTQDVRSLAGGSTVRAFQLNEKGRILADVLMHHGDADTWLEADCFDLGPLRNLLDARLFAEDVMMEDFTPHRVALALHGPAAEALLRELTDDGDASAPVHGPGTHHVLTLAGGPVTVYRWDDAGSLGLRLLIPAGHAARLYSRLLSAAGYEPNQSLDAATGERRRASHRGRPIGWAAYNTARIEAGTPLFHVDFGTDSLPGETGLLDQTTSFTKGCYLGQEIVARMKHLGHPRRLLVGMTVSGEGLPVAGAQVLDAADGSTVVGAITSSTLSPLRSGAPIALAVMKWGKHEPGTRVLVPTGRALAPGEVTRCGFMD